MFTKRFVFLTLLILLINEFSFSQDSIVVYYNRDFKGKRPKLGLVLSGGGAKGMAHVGVLRVLERTGLKPDYITGTSMGSIVGGLYAIGFTPDSLEELMEQQDWTEVLSNNLNLLDVNMEEKWDYGEYIAELPFYGWKPGLPQGYIKGHELELLFNKLTVSVATDTNFDDFYIPFRAVSVDMLKGEPYVFKSGSLATAMRSSMSIPTIMNPIKYRGMLLVDGGLMKNFPVDVCKEMGADIIIGVYTGGELLPEEKLNSLFALLKQSSLMAGIKDSKEQQKSVDLYIEPYLSDLSAADFNKVDIFTDRGFQAASRKYSDFMRMEEFYRQFPQKDKQRPIMKDSVMISKKNFFISNSNNMSNKLVTSVLKSKEYNKWVTPDELKNQIDLLYGTRLFKKISYDYTPAKDTNTVELNYNVDMEKDRQLTFALQYKSESKFGVNVGFRYRNLLIKGSKLDLKLRLSEFPAFRGRYFSYIGYKLQNGISFSYFFNLNPLTLYKDNSQIGNYNWFYNSTRVTYFHYFSRNSELYANYSKEISVYNRKIDLSNYYFGKLKSSINSISIGYMYNKLNKKYFATKGSKLNIYTKYNWNTVETYYVDEDTLANNPELEPFFSDTIDYYINIGLSYDKYLKIAPKLVLENEFNALVALHSNYTSLNSRWIGGVNVDPNYQIAFWGLPENGEIFNNVGIYRIGLRYNFFDKLYITAKANLMFRAVDITKIFDTSLDPIALDSYIGYYDNYLFGTGLQLSYESLIGPISVTVTKGSYSSAFWWHILFGYKF